MINIEEGNANSDLIFGCCIHVSNYHMAPINIFKYYVSSLKIEHLYGKKKIQEQMTLRMVHIFSLGDFDLLL
jgi:hypothetical protein